MSDQRRDLGQARNGLGVAAGEATADVEHGQPDTPPEQLAQDSAIPLDRAPPGGRVGALRAHVEGDPVGVQAVLDCEGQKIAARTELAGQGERARAVVDRQPSVDAATGRLLCNLV